MCGRFVGFRKLEELTQYFPIDQATCEVTASYNIAPSQEVLAIYRQSEKNWLDKFNWGLVPHWAKDRTTGTRLINARAETVADKPSFKIAFKRQRCLIPADGFYEWSGPKGQKQPYFFTLHQQAPFAFAGIWEKWKSKDDPGQNYRSCAIITTAASPSVRPIHHRMPVILRPDAYPMWLDPDQQDTELLTEIMREKIVTEINYVPVSKQVNAARSNNPSNLVPLKQMKFDF